jgi:hypothetical protein
MVLLTSGVKCLAYRENLFAVAQLLCLIVFCGVMLSTCCCSKEEGSVRLTGAYIYCYVGICYDPVAQARYKRNLQLGSRSSFCLTFIFLIYKTMTLNPILSIR